MALLESQMDVNSHSELDVWSTEITVAYKTQIWYLSSVLNIYVKTAAILDLWNNVRKRPSQKLRDLFNLDVFSQTTK